ncbi:KEOPS complex subunit Cgi121 [Natrinema thermotolerans]|uniref:KEOPS complex subunit Cgi121 n=1 Tax=Natrinema thermotolerans TaxID=121872 RepID=A0AAF0PGJ2_9EURY|nr:KEOPS complex subunit Cgi121 [Natrinema thermotolerans]QCC58801.1 KEOPS complex component [Natrinema thermotolerans]WMT09959.1 KEOPS complex subunit Cgi121 [Natrinema thermotolerans]
MELLECTLVIDDLDEFVAALGELGDRHGVTVQAFDSRYVADRRHLERAVELADRAIDRGENVARDRAVEILLYAAGRRQIDRALEMGVDEGETQAVVLVDGDGDERAALEAVEDLTAFHGRTETLGSRDDETLCDFFGVPDAERAATDAGLAALVRERVALLEVEK